MRKIELGSGYYIDKFADSSQIILKELGMDVDYVSDESVFLDFFPTKLDEEEWGFFREKMILKYNVTIEVDDKVWEIAEQLHHLGYR